MTTPTRTLYRSYNIEEYHFTEEPYYMSTGDEVDIKKLLDGEKQQRPEAPSSFVSLRSSTGVSEADKLSFAGLQRLG